ncbi:MAG TPA: DUF6064 family protein [Longimicrobiales bacterium]|nr:DUF6064 family protein [Longimicrobiales bacterium]
MLPFTTAQFLEVFARYNMSVWPAQVGFYALAVILVALAVRAPRPHARWIAASLAFLWAWMGLVYHGLFFARINPAAYLFGALFLAQAALFLHAGVLRRRLSFRARPDAAGVLGAAAIVYALVVYPLLGALAGHPYPFGATFGLPCPTTIFTFGLLLWAEAPVPISLVVLPAAWSALASFAALSLTISEDYALVPTAVLAIALIARGNRRPAPAAPAAPPSPVSA